MPSSAACFLAHCLVRIEAGRYISSDSCISQTLLLTLEEFLAGVLLEEGLVGDGTCEVINHELKDRLHFFLVIASIVSQSSIL